MYRCKVCNAESEPGQSLLRHQVKRKDGQIASELPVCKGCLQRLKTTSLDDLIREYSKEPAATRVAPIAAVPLRAVAVPSKTLAQRINESNTRSA